MRQVQAGDTITVNYTGRFEDGTVFDTSKTQGRTPLSVILGTGGLIKGFEEGVIGMTVGETKTITVPPHLGYGPYNEANVQEIFRTSLPPDIQVGMMINGQDQNQRPIQAKVIEINETTAKIDLNNPLAGKTLTFEVDLIHIN
jgi:peptidylprolyl isomerase